MASHFPAWEWSVEFGYSLPVSLPKKGSVNLKRGVIPNNIAGLKASMIDNMPNDAHCYPTKLLLASDMNHAPATTEQSSLGETSKLLAGHCRRIFPVPPHLLPSPAVAEQPCCDLALTRSAAHFNVHRHVHSYLPPSPTSNRQG